MYGRSLRETFRAVCFGAVDPNSVSSSAVKPTRATPLKIPIVAGIPPFSRTTDSSSNGNTMQSACGYPWDCQPRRSSGVIIVSCYHECRWSTPKQPPVSLWLLHRKPLQKPGRTHCGSSSWLLKRHALPVRSPGGSILVLQSFSR